MVARTGAELVGDCKMEIFLDVEMADIVQILLVGFLGTFGSTRRKKVIFKPRELCRAGQQVLSCGILATASARSRVGITGTSLVKEDCHV